MKSPEIPQEKTAGVIRIAILGASTTEGSSGNENTYPTQLEKILKQQGFNVEIINAAHGGYTIDDILAFYQQFVIPVDPDLVIFYEGSMNNVNFNEWIKNYDFKFSQNYIKLYPSWFQTIYQHSALFVKLTNNLIFYKKNLSQNHEFNQELPKQSLNHYQEKVQELLSIAKENKQTIILATFITVAHQDLDIPRYHKNPYIWESLKLQLFPFTTREIATIHEAYNQVLKNLATAESIPLINTAIVFPKQVQYFNDYVHLTPEGDRLLANFIT